MSGKKIGFAILFIGIVLILFLVLLNPFKSEKTSNLEINEEKISLIQTIDRWDEIYDIAYSNDGEKIAIGSDNGVHIYSIEMNDIIVSNTGEEAPESRNLEFSSDDSLLLSGWHGVAIYNTEDLSEVMNLHGGRQSYIDFSPDGSTIATGNMEGIVWLWDTDSGEKIKAFDHRVGEWVTALNFSFKDNILAAGFLDGTVRIWNVKSDELILNFEFESAGEINDLAFSPSGKILAVVEPDLGREVHILSLEESSRKKILDNPESSVRSLDFSPDGKIFAYGEYNGTVDIWDTANWSLTYSFELGSVNSLAFSPISNNLAVGTSEGKLYIYRMKNNP